MAAIYEIFGFDAHGMTVRLMEAADVVSMIPRGASVALKPNLVLARGPESGATTHPGVLSGAVEYLLAHGIPKQDISIIEGSWVGDNTARAMKACGYDEVAQRFGVEFHDLKKDATRTVKTALRPMSVCCRALDAGFLINLPVLKGHCQTVMTCALKNCKGCLPDAEKRRFHAEGLTRPIAALAAALKPALTIVDSICGDLDFEEGGNPVSSGRMYLGTDPVQLDAYGCRLMGLPLEQVEYIGLAERYGAGSTKLLDGDVVQINEPVEGMAVTRPSGRIAGLTRGVEEKSACSACYSSLVRALYQLKNRRDANGIPIAIGQGWKDEPFAGIGIGRCCNRCSRQVPGCPPSADDIVRELIR